MLCAVISSKIRLHSHLFIHERVVYLSLQAAIILFKTISFSLCLLIS